MAITLRQPWMDHHGGGGAHRPERYVLQAVGEGADGVYFGIARSLRGSSGSAIQPGLGSSTPISGR
jgi:hypothetical protein